MQIPGIGSNQLPDISGLTGVQKNASTQKNTLENLGTSFADILNGLNESQLNADNLVQQLASGGNVDLDDVMIALEENDINFKVAMAIRDKLVDAYREVMRMQV